MTNAIHSSLVKYYPPSYPVDKNREPIYTINGMQVTKDEFKKEWSYYYPTIEVPEIPGIYKGLKTFVVGKPRKIVLLRMK